MTGEAVIIKLVHFAGRTFITIYKGKKDVTSEYKEVTLTFEKSGKVTATNLRSA